MSGVKKQGKVSRKSSNPSTSLHSKSTGGFLNPLTQIKTWHATGLRIDYLCSPPILDNHDVSHFRKENLNTSRKIKARKRTKTKEKEEKERKSEEHKLGAENPEEDIGSNNAVEASYLDTCYPQCRDSLVDLPTRGRHPGG